MHSEQANHSETPTSGKESTKAPRILIVRGGAIGDTLMVTPLVRALRRKFTDAWLVLLASRAGHELLRCNPHLDEIIPLAYRHLPGWLSLEKLRIARRLRSLKLDCALALETHSDILGFVGWFEARRVIAYGQSPRAAGFERAAFDPKQHSIQNHLRAARPLGVEPQGTEMELCYPPELDERVEQRLARAGIRKDRPLVGIHPGWGNRKQATLDTRLRSWPADRFAAVIRWLRQTVGAEVVLTGSGADRPVVDFVASLSAVPCLNLAGELRLLEMSALIRRLQLYLTVDSGPAHMAAALGTPLVTLWGPGIFEQTAPVPSRGPVRVLYHRVHCAPCYGTPLMKTCQDNICMKEIEVAEVQEAMTQMLASSGPGTAGGYSGSILASSTSITGMSSLMG